MPRYYNTGTERATTESGEYLHLVDVRCHPLALSPDLRMSHPHVLPRPPVPTSIPPVPSAAPRHGRPCAVAATFATYATTPSVGTFALLGLAASLPFEPGQETPLCQRRRPPRHSATLRTEQIAGRRGTRDLSPIGDAEMHRAIGTAR